MNRAWNSKFPTLTPHILAAPVAVSATQSAPKRRANEQSHKMLTDAVGRAFKHRTTALMTCLCSSLSGAPPGRLQGQGLDHLKAPSRTHVAVGAVCRPGLRFSPNGPLRMVGLGLLTAGGWVLKERGSWRLQHQHGLVLEVTQYHFLHILLTDAATRSCPSSDGEEIDFASWWGATRFWKGTWDWKYCCDHFWKLQSATLTGYQPSCFTSLGLSFLISQMGIIIVSTV